MGSIWHIGVAVRDLEKGTAATTPLLNRGPSGTSSNSAICTATAFAARSVPAQSEFAGEPILGSAL